MSFVGWLDYSEADQRQMRELLRFFEDRGTVDDLGIGTVRDAISNRLFPGTSVVQTRARYFLFIPWIFRRAEQRHRTQIVAHAEVMEKRLIGALKESEDQDGLIGRQAGKDVKTLPSAIFWTGLAAYGIFRQPGVTRSQYGRSASRTTTMFEGEDELSERTRTYWDPAIPDPPLNFFDFSVADFALTHDEATWLSERVLSTEAVRGPSLIGSYVRSLRSNGHVPKDVFWAAPLPDGVDEEIAQLAAHAEQFSCLIRGAALLYNLLLAKSRGNEAKGDHETVAARRGDLEDWAEDGTDIGVRDWCGDLQAFWGVVTRTARIPRQTRRFVDEWAAIVHGAQLSSLADSGAATTCIRSREVEHKRSQARLANPTRLDAWEGESGLAPLEFRWFQVRRFLTDLANGFDAAVPAPREVARAAN